MLLPLVFRPYFYPDWCDLQAPEKEYYGCVNMAVE